MVAGRSAAFFGAGAKLRAEAGGADAKAAAIRGEARALDARRRLYRRSGALRGASRRSPLCPCRGIRRTVSREGAAGPVPVARRRLQDRASGHARAFASLFVARGGAPFSLFVRAFSAIPGFPHRGRGGRMFATVRRRLSESHSPIPGRTGFRGGDARRVERGGGPSGCRGLVDADRARPFFRGGAAAVFRTPPGGPRGGFPGGRRGSGGGSGPRRDRFRPARCRTSACRWSATA